MIRLATLLVLGSLAAEARPVRLCLVGDSITAGFSPATYGWSVPLAVRHAQEDFGIKNAAHSGDTVAMSMVLFAKDVQRRGCTHVAILIGTNDIQSAMGNSNSASVAAGLFAGIDAMADAAEEEGARVILLAILPRGTGIWNTNLENHRLALNALMQARANSVYVDTDTALRGTCTATGIAPAWAAQTAYSVGAVRVANNQAFVVMVAGTSAASGGPTGTANGQVDGTVTWNSVPCLATAYGGATDGGHPSNAGQNRIADTVDAAVLAAGGWD